MAVPTKIGIQKQFGFGLHVRTKEKPAEVSAPKRKNVFGATDEENEKHFEMTAQIERESVQASAARRVRREQEKAQEMDPTIFEYDEVYDDLHKEAKEAERKKKIRKAQYIPNLMKKAVEREFEYEKVRDRMELKEREKEGAEFADKGKFVTAAYKKRLQERLKWEEDQRRRDALDEDVTKKKDTGAFLRTLMQRDMVMGADDAPEVVAAVARQKKPQGPPPDAASAMDAAVKSADPRDAADDSSNDESERSGGRARSRPDNEDDRPGRSAAAQQERREHSHGGTAGKAERGQSPQPSSRRRSRSRSRSRDRAAPVAPSRTIKPEPGAAPSRDAPRESPPAAAPTAEDKAAAARARYLARKK